MLTHLQLRYFKNFIEADLKLGPFTLLVGANASGKSNLRDAFRFLHGIGRGYNIAEIIGEKYGENGVLQWRGIRGGNREIAYGTENHFFLGIYISETEDIIATHLEHRYAYHLDVLLEERYAKVFAEELINGDGHIVYQNDDLNTVRGSRTIPVWVQTGEDGRHEMEQFSNASPVLSQIFDGVKNAEYGSLVSNAVGEVTQLLSSIRFLDLDPDAMRRPTFPGQDVLGDRGENLSSVLYAITEEEDGSATLLSWLQELTPMDTVGFEFPTDQTGKILATLVEANGNKTSLYSASDGTLRFLAMVAALLGPKPARFYFFEEIDSGIHPTRLHLLLQLIEQVVSEGKIQVIATTHSPSLLRLLSPKSLEFASLVYRSHEHPAARIIPLLDLPEARRVFETQDVATLFETGWLEDIVAFGDADKEFLMRVLIITEDFTQDQYIVKPIVEAMLAAVGKPHAKVEVCRDPRFQGVAQALDWKRLTEVIDRYRGMVDLFILCVDRDNNLTRRAALGSLEVQAQSYAPDKVFLSEHAWQELEVWLLAGHDLPTAWDWKTIRAEEHPKENYYLPFAQQRNVHRQPAQGRSTLALEAAKRYTRIRQLCPEDIAVLEQRIRTSLP